MYTTQYDKLSEDQKEKINVLNRPENLALDFIEYDLSPMPPLEDHDKVQLEPEETIAKIVKLNPRKRKKTEIDLKILTPDNLLTIISILLSQIKLEAVHT